MKNNFPSIDTVHETLSDLTKLFEDRNAILNSMFREDKYKDFLLAENIQSLVEADKRDDASGGKIKKDLANGYEILKAKTNMQKFASFISPGMLPTLDLSEKGDYDDDGLDYENDMYDKEGGSEESSTPEKGEKGDKGDTGDVNVNMDAPKSGGFNNRLTNPSGSQNSGLKLAEGGVVPPSPMMNAMNPSAQRPETKSGVKSLESLGLVGKKNVASELTEDLGLEEYKKALADAMALPLKAVAAGLAGLMDNIDVPGGEGAAIGAQTNSIAKAFDVTPSKKKKEKEDKGNPLLGIAKMLLPFGMGAKKPKPKSYSISSSNSFSIDGAGNIIDEKSSYSDSRDQPQGGPSLTPHPGTLMGWGGASHETKAPDQLSSQGDTRMDSIKNTISNVAQGAKNMFMKHTTVGMGISAASGVITKMLGKVQPASEGSQYERQDVNSLTNQVVNNNEVMLHEKTQMIVQNEKTEGGRAAATKMRELFADMSKAQKKTMGNASLAPTEIRVSKYLTASLVTTHGGETLHDL
tara:strand:+ start:4993 stop:6558 length:1566 start_codon:yes stop_codon:yes gene_type:complete